MRLLYQEMVTTPAPPEDWGCFNFVELDTWLASLLHLYTSFPFRYMLLCACVGVFMFTS